jgi:hypothetical protein
MLIVQSPSSATHRPSIPRNAFAASAASPLPGTLLAGLQLTPSNPATPPSGTDTHRSPGTGLTGGITDDVTPPDDE